MDLCADTRLSRSSRPSWTAVVLGGAVLVTLAAPALGRLRLLADGGHPGWLWLIGPLVIVCVMFGTAMARVKESNRHLLELNDVYLATVETLGMAIDAKDHTTHGHIRRVQAYAGGLARTLGITDPASLRAIEAAALLHDIGKLSVPEFILNKPGKLTPAEYERIKLHAPIGASILSQINFPYPVVPIVRHHHESWDGSGYPDGLAGEAIPIGARIMAVVDCYDALTSDRPYREAMAEDEALGVVIGRRGTMYDPRVVDAFLEVYRDIRPERTPRVDDAHALLRLPRLPLPPNAEGSAATPGGATAAEDILRFCELAEGLGGHATLDDAAEVMGRHLRRMLPAPLVVFYRTDERTGDLCAAHVSGVGAEHVRGMRVPLGAGLSGWVAANRTTMINSSPALDLGTRIEALSPRPESALSTPLVTEGQVVGVLALYAATRDAFTDDHRRVIELVARQVAAAMVRAAAFEHTQQVLLRDEATGLPNARRLNDLLASRAFADNQPGVSFGVLSVGPGFGRGTEAGDEPLRHAAAAATRALRASDLVFRYGERELVILLPENDPAATRRVAERLVTAIRDNHTAPGRGAPVQVGLAFTPDDGQSIDELLRVARGRVTPTLRGGWNQPTRRSGPAPRAGDGDVA